AIPAAKRMEKSAVEQRLTSATGVEKSVQTPLVADNSNFKEHARVRVHAGFGVALSQVEPALFRRAAAIGTKQRLKRKRVHSRQRMILDEQRVIDSVELDRFSKRRLDDF